ncbi:hypothetical protein D3C84_1248900 [compost metagenome]
MKGLSVNRSDRVSIPRRVAVDRSKLSKPSRLSKKRVPDVKTASAPDPVIV